MSRSLLLALLLASAAPAQDRVKDLAAHFEGKVSVYAKNLKTGAIYSLGGDTRVNTASTIKLPILIGVYTAVASGKVRWSDTSELTNENKVGGFHERAAPVNSNPVFLLPVRIGVLPTNGRHREAFLFPPQRGRFVFRFVESVRNRRIALLPSALWLFAGAVWGPQFTPGAAISRLELAACFHKQWFSRPCSQSPELGDLQSESALKLQAAAASALLLRSGS
jgi:Beta-lactamase enzyme family